MEQNYFAKLNQNVIKSKRDIQATLVFNISKIYQKEYQSDHNYLPFKITSRKAR